jgi:tRNA pseudouridine55 synthase
VELFVRCSSGTYVRALARDLGESLGVGAHLTALRRTAVGPFRVEQAVTVDALGDERTGQALLTPEAALAAAGVPTVEVEPRSAARLAQGQAVAGAEGLPAAGGLVAVVDASGLVAIAECREGVLMPRKVFRGAVTSG